MAIEQSHKEVEKMGAECIKMLTWLDELRDADKPDKRLADKLKNREQVLDAMQDEIAVYVTEINEAYIQNNRSVLTKTVAMSKRLRSQIKQHRRNHMDELSGGGIPPLVSVAYLASLNAYARVRDHAENVAEAVSGER